MSLVEEQVVRALTDNLEVLEGIKRGIYTIWGGVIRKAPGTPGAGQIVGHLQLPDNPARAQEAIERLAARLQEGMGSLESGLGQLQQSINVLQGLQVANLALSGLNLAVTTAGFVIVCNKLNKLSAQISAQSRNIALTLAMVGEAHDRALMGDEAQFRALVMSAQQFCQMRDIDQLKSLVPAFIREYEFSRLVLQRHAGRAESTFDRLHEIALIQDRFINLGLLLSHVQIQIGAPKQAQEVLRDLAVELPSLNAARIEAMAADQALPSRISTESLRETVAFLEAGRSVVPAISYEADLLDLQVSHPGRGLLAANDSAEILLLSA